MKQKRKYAVSIRRTQQKEETQSIILESAKILFEKLGYDKTTIRAIANKAGIGLGTIFNYFPDKSSLLIAALLDDLNKIEKSVFNTIPENTSIIEKFLYITKMYYDYYAKRPSLSRTLLGESNFVPGKFGELLKFRIKGTFSGSLPTKILIPLSRVFSPRPNPISPISQCWVSKCFLDWKNTSPI